MWNTPSEKQLSSIPMLYATDSITTAEKNIYIHLFLGNCDWFIAEYDGKDLFYGFAILNGDYEMGEWGYISFSELTAIKIGYAEIEHDLYWKVRRVSDIDKIIKCRGGI
jgi:hypothetical protein